MELTIKEINSFKEPMDSLNPPSPPSPNQTQKKEEVKLCLNVKQMQM